tara:strand:+ start:1712 stop:2359 length:648 start_codon:yes stop_codon:yes gene_type:complete
LQNNKLISKLLKQISKITVCESNRDGRLNSIKDEKTLIDKIKQIATNSKEFEVYEPPPRHWYDLMVNGIPIQIKSSSGKTDNWSSKKSLLWALSDLSMEEIDAIVNRPKVIQKKLGSISCVKNGSYRDMDILCIDKNTGKVHHKTLCSLSKLISNGSNLPFQIPWKANLKSQPVTRSHHEAFTFIIEAYRSSIMKKQDQDDLETLEESLRRASAS